MRPSELFNLEDSFTAWAFDRAVHYFGTTVEADLEEAAEGARDGRAAQSARLRRFAKWMSTDGNVMKGAFRDPAATRTKSL